MMHGDVTYVDAALKKNKLSIVFDDLAEDAADVIFQSPDAQIKMTRPYMYNAPVWIIFSAKLHDENETPNYELMNVNLLWNVGSIIENMELRATDLGLASCGCTLFYFSKLDL